jgi:saccharopine dehydrogenase-like NADP-dependent oxidoreductase
MANIVVLGAGRIGKAIAIDLAQQHTVVAVDKDHAALEEILQQNPAIQTLQFDLLDTRQLNTVTNPADLVISAVPGFLGFQVLKQIISAKRNVVDISFFPEDSLALDQLAKQHGVTAIVDMGIAPGMSNLILGYHNQHMQVNEFQCMVGGLPKSPRPPFNYKASFSPVDVIEEYTRPVRMVIDGKPVTRPALSDIEPIDVPRIGKLEAFNTDGLRTLLTTMPAIPTMVEKTLRYPGHAELIKTLQSIGFFSPEPITEIGHYIRPLDVTAHLLKRHWLLEKNEPEFTVMRIGISGTEQNNPVHYQYDLYDEYDSATQTTSMARTTGYACTAAASLVLNNAFTTKGVNPPEIVGANNHCYEFIMDYLKQRNILFTQQRIEN